MSCVSHSWKQAVCNDKESRERRLHYLELQAINKVYIIIDFFNSKQILLFIVLYVTACGACLWLYWPLWYTVHFDDIQVCHISILK